MKPLPKPEYPFPEGINVHVDAIQEMTGRWVKENYTFLSPDMQRKYIRASFGSITSRCLPDITSLQSFIPCARFMLWATVLDDYYEHCNAEQLRQVKDRITAIFKGDQAREEEHFLIRESAPIRDGLAAFMPEMWMARFTEHLYIYLESLEFEIPYKKSDQFPPLDAFLTLRELTIGAYTFIDFIEIEIGCALPDEIHAHPYMKEIYSLTSRIFAWCNDFYSIEKDLGREPLNLVFILQHEHALSLEEANVQALKLNDEDAQRLLYLQKNVPDFGEHTHFVRAFAHYAGIMLQGQSQWYKKDTRRYLTGGYPESHTFKDVPNNDGNNL